MNISLKDVKNTYKAFLDRNVFQKSASLSYYTLITGTGGLLLFTSVAGIFFEDGFVNTLFIEEVERIFGGAVSESLTFFLQTAERARHQIASVIGFFLVLFFSTSAVTDAQRSLASIFGIKRSTTVKGFLWRRLISLGVLLSTTFLFIFIVVATWVLSVIAISGFLIDLPAFTTIFINFFGLVLFSSIFFFLLYRTVGAKMYDDKHLFISALLAGVLFSIGKSLIELYISFMGLVSIYGAGGLLIASLIWIYYSSCIFYVGACFCRVKFEKQNL